MEAIEIMIQSLVQTGFIVVMGMLAIIGLAWVVKKMQG